MRLRRRCSVASVVQPTNVNHGLGLTPGKLKLIGVLSAVLLGVLYLQFGGSEPEAPATKPAGKPRRTAAASDTPAAAGASPVRTASAELADISAWDTPELEQVVQYDPFALPAAFPQPKATAALALSESGASALAQAKLDEETRVKMQQQIEGELGKMRQQGVQVILTRGDQFIAMIGGKTYHVGDKIGGFTITAIDANGVHVERAVQP
jgi:hypothetical protein